MAMLDVQNLSISFGGLKAVFRFDLTVEPGEIRGLIGPNGSGKTTLFNLITGFYPPLEGKIHFQGEDITRLKPHKIAAKGIARTFQNVQIFSGMSVAENIKVGHHVSLKTGLLGAAFAIGRITGQENNSLQKAEDLLRMIGMQELSARPAGSLPFGQQRKVEVLRAIAMEPKLLLLDEPTSGLSISEKEEMADFMKWLRNKLGITILLVEHDVRLVAQVADYITAMDFGQKITEGTPEQVLSDPKVLEAYIGTEKSSGSK
jgi:branched-chain amino acid transport system ATP-binding protein